jgi:hypothetical protein
MNGTDTATAADSFIKAAPPVAVSSLSFIGLPMQEWVYIVTIVYTLIQIIRVFPKTVYCIRCFSKAGLKCTRACKGYNNG